MFLTLVLLSEMQGVVCAVQNNLSLSQWIMKMAMGSSEYLDASIQGWATLTLNL